VQCNACLWRLLRRLWRAGGCVVILPVRGVSVDVCLRGASWQQGCRKRLFERTAAACFRFNSRCPTCILQLVRSCQTSEYAVVVWIRLPLWCCWGWVCTSAVCLAAGCLIAGGSALRSSRPLLLLLL
jgi:hypothetical protein